MAGVIGWSRFLGYANAVVVHTFFESLGRGARDDPFSAVVLSVLLVLIPVAHWLDWHSQADYLKHNRRLAAALLIAGLLLAVLAALVAVHAWQAAREVTG